jgi:HD-GYP domain-containing protein (c-di-GMP phosphodiesterase class II)
MRLVNIKYVEEGSVLARSVRNANGNVLLGEGVVLNKNYLSKLESLGIDMLFIQDERFKDIDFNPAISEKTREGAYKTIRLVATNLETTRSAAFDADSVKSAVSDIINDLLYSFDVLSNLNDIMGYDEYTYQHSINTTVLALLLGMGKGCRAPDSWSWVWG